MLNAGGLSSDSVTFLVFDKEIPSYEKYEFEENGSNGQNYDLLVSIITSLLATAKQQHNYPVQMQLYNQITEISLLNYKLDQAEIYLDSAFLLEKRVNDLHSLFSLYNYAGIYYAYRNDQAESHKNFYKAIKCCEKIGGMENKIIITLYNISLGYIEDEDQISLKNSIDRMVMLQPHANTSLTAFITTAIKAKYYLIEYQSCNYSDETTKKLLLDSVQTYCNKAIQIYDNAYKTGTKLNSIWNFLVSKCYADLAILESERFRPDWDKVFRYMDKSKSLFISKDPVYILNNIFLRSKFYYYQENYALAIEKGHEALTFIDPIYQDSIVINTDKYDPIKKNIYSILALSYRAIGNFNLAYDYKSLESSFSEKILNRSRIKTIRDIETKYDAKAKEHEIQISDKNNLYKTKIRNLYFCVFILLIIIFVITIYILWKNRKKEPERKIINEDASNSEIIPDENESKQDELKKYEALLEAHFKEIEMEENGTDTDKNKQDETSEIQKCTLNSSDTEEVNNTKPYTDRKKNRTGPLVDEITHLIEKKCDEDKKELYIENLNLINDGFLSRLEDASGNSISTAYTKYSICFVIGMEIKEVAECFFVELSSIHMIRYRLKKKLKLGNDDDLDIFLGNMLKESQ